MKQQEQYSIEERILYYLRRTQDLRLSAAQRDFAEVRLGQLFRSLTGDLSLLGRILEKATKSASSKKETA